MLIDFKDTRSGNEIIAEGLEKYNSRDQDMVLNDTIEAAFLKILQDHAKGFLKWNKTGDYLTDWFAMVKVKNCKGVEMEIPAILHVRGYDGGADWHLSLATKDKSPGYSESEPRIYMLIEDVTGRNLGYGPIKWNYKTKEFDKYKGRMDDDI